MSHTKPRPLSSSPLSSSALCALCASAILFLPHSPLFSQSAPPTATTPLDLLLPGFLRTGYSTRVWVRDSLPPRSDSLSDLDRMDLIYLHALNEASGDYSQALIAATIATFEHRTIPLQIGIDLPLTLESQEKFDRRVANLPDILFADIPEGNDRDKLQHFFASAWLTWTLDDGWAADMVGLGIEVGEEWILQGGVSDRRDIRANRLGQIFAQLLRNHPDALPSMAIRAWNREYERRFGGVSTSH